MTDYPFPVAELLKLGEERGAGERDYLRLGLGPGHVPDLIRMALDRELDQAEDGILVVTLTNLVAISLRNHLRRKYAGSAI